MEDKNTVWDRLEKFMDGKGFYIVLFACIAVIGVSAGTLILAETRQNSTDVVGITDDYTAPVFDASIKGKTQAPVKKNEKDTAPEQTDAQQPSAAEEPVSDEAEPEAAEMETVAGTEDGRRRVFMRPVVGATEVGYHVEDLCYSKTMADWRIHPGIDIAAAIGTKVRAVSDGTVAGVEDDDMYGTTVTIDHGDGLCSVYANLASEPVVRVGDEVEMGDVIGSIGDTALCETGEVQHLHFAMTLDGSYADPDGYLPESLV